MSIVGRPNVGKSALFNRIVGSRRAIVEDLPGTTRDRLEAPVTWNTLGFRLVDTGGLQPGSKEPLARLVHDQALTAMREARIILFIVDGKQGITPLDQEVADLLRQATAPVLLVANKIDNVQREWGTTEFFALGLGEPRLVSAYHGTGVGELLDEVAGLLPSCEVPDEETIHALRIAIVGRPNVGKSMLLNRLLGLPRVLVSEIPGTTRDAIDTPLQFQGREYLL
ncbi:MAG: 50S ribosome-binding GTPase, partial [Chloroflexi bacterium]|nr:50S ribosome-binding GTPase [Chloroflexota bacterium]